MTNFWAEKQFHVFPIFAHFCSFSRIARFGSEKTQKKKIGFCTWPHWAGRSDLASVPSKFRPGERTNQQKMSKNRKVFDFFLGSRFGHVEWNCSRMSRSGGEQLKDIFLLFLYCAPLRRALWLGLRFSDFRPGRSKISK